MLLLITLFTFISFNSDDMSSPQEEYRQEKVTYLVTYLQKNNREIESYDYQLQTNFAFIYILKNKQVVILPGNLSSYENGLILKNEAVLKKMIQDDYFPVEVVDIYQYEIYKDKLINLPDYVAENFLYLNQNFNLNIESEKFDNLSFEDVNRQLNGYNLKKQKDNNILALTFLLGEIIIKKEGGYWKINKEYGVYNSYYVPVIVLNKSKVELHVMDIITSEIENSHGFDLKFCYERLTNPKLNMDLNSDVKNIYNGLINND